MWLSRRGAVVPLAPMLKGPQQVAIRQRVIGVHVAIRHHSVNTGDTSKPPVKLVWQNAKGEQTAVDAYEGQTLMDVAKQHHIDMEGACEGSCACSTCHVKLPEDVFDALADSDDTSDHASEKEDDMLDQAFDLSPTSRLGCQIKVQRKMMPDGTVITLPSATRNMAVDGYKAEHH